MSDYLESLYSKYNIDNLPYGKQSDALGDLYEEYVKYVFSNDDIVKKFNSKSLIGIWGRQEDLFFSVCEEYNIEHVSSIEIISVPPRDTRGAPKTDVCVRINDKIVKISIKQSHAKAIAVAEFDVGTISREVGITDTQLISLMEKFQRDGSGKNFEVSEKHELTERMQNFKDDFVRWAISGTREVNSDDLRAANHTIMFMIDKNTKRLKDFSTYTIEKQISKITSKSSGYGTGLSWTYATGSKGKKIQLKCPVI
tara:strand:- start:2582 stop:3343 length:762 start_codon:yes stop_codon:yes gene_type:complete